MAKEEQINSTDELGGLPEDMGVISPSQVLSGIEEEVQRRREGFARMDAKRNAKLQADLEFSRNPTPPPAPPLTLSDGACNGLAGPDNPFFPPFGEKKADRLLREQKAKSICGECAVKDLCLEARITNNNNKGDAVWGGKNKTEIKAAIRNRRLG